MLEVGTKVFSMQINAAISETAGGKHAGQGTGHQPRTRQFTLLLSPHREKKTATRTHAGDNKST